LDCLIVTSRKHQFRFDDIEKEVKLRDDLGISDQNLALSIGWLSKFKKRNGIRNYKLHGESGSANVTNISESIVEINNQISSYDPCDVYNFDETALFYRLLPTYSLARKAFPGSKKCKDRISLGFCVSMGVRIREDC
jgi:hypothetical protein